MFSQRPHGRAKVSFIEQKAVTKKEGKPHSRLPSLCHVTYSLLFLFTKVILNILVLQPFRIYAHCLETHTHA